MTTMTKEQAKAIIQNILDQLKLTKAELCPLKTGKELLTTR